MRTHPEVIRNLTNDEGELNFSAIWAVIWNEKWVVIAFTLLASIVSSIFAYNATPWYRADVLFTLTTSKSADGLAGQLGGLGGLVSLAGINLSTGGAAEPIAILKSREFTRSFIEQEQLLPTLSSQSKKSLPYFWSDGGPESPADIRDAVKFFNEEIRDVQEDKKTGLVTLTVQWTDPQVAAKWANEFVASANARIRARALAEAQANVSYLQKELAMTSVVTLQQSVGRLLDAELQKVMIAKGKTEFAFRIVDSAQVPKLRFRPKRVQIVLASTTLGAAIAIILVLLRSGYRNRNSK